MSEKDDLLVYDDDDAVKFILANLSDDLKAKFNEDDINYVLDVLYEYYDSNGYLDEESEEEVVIDEEEIFNFVKKEAKKDKMTQFSDEDLKDILDGEFEYCRSIGIFSDEDEE